jgi:hypothetical protein
MLRFNVRNAGRCVVGLAVLLVAMSVGTSVKANVITVGGQVLSDDFSGTTLDPSKWSFWGTNGGTAVVGSDVLTINTLSSNGTGVVYGKNLDFSASPTDWWADTKFQIASGALEGTNHTYHVFSGWDDFYNLTNIKGIDLRAIQNGETSGPVFDLGWYGYDNANGSRATTLLTAGLNKGQYYQASLHRKSDGNVDIYLDGNLISTQALINGVNPTQIGVGDVEGSYEQGLASWDYIKVGQGQIVSPEPSGIAILIAGGLSLLAYAWRKLK